MKRNLSILLLLIIPWTAFAQPDESEAALWAEKTFRNLTEDERLGQLFMIAAYSNKGPAHIREIENTITQYQVGGLIFFQGGPVRQAHLTNRYQQLAKTPLLIAIDGEWGLDMRLDSTMYFPKQMTLGALQNDTLIYEMGREVGRQCRRLGIHVNFAPVADINSNPQNPIIGVRSFGENKENVAQKSIAYMRGMQDEHVIACAKHFPGHGDTGSDSHVTLPVIRHSRERLDTLELYPFRQLIEAGIKSMMVAHIHVPEYDNRTNRATTLSKNVVTDLLKKDMGFDGLVFTDALNMKGVSQFYKPGLVDVEALLAGNDVLLFAEDVGEAIIQIKKAIKKKQITQEEVDDRVKKILRAKYQVGLHDYQPVETAGLVDDLNNPQAMALRKQLYQEAITIVNNRDNLLPLHILDTLQMASVVIGEQDQNRFQKTLSKYAPFAHFQVADGAAAGAYNSIESQLGDASLVVVGIHHTGKWFSRFAIPDAAIAFIDRLSKTKKVVVVLFGNAYSAANFQHAPWLVAAYENKEAVQQVVPQVLFGALPARGKLPVSPTPSLKAGSGFQTGSLHRLRYSIPEEIGINSRHLIKIDSIARAAIAMGATPGCQVLVAKDGHVIFNHAYGHHTYDQQQVVEEHTLYDLASVTKVAVATQTLMFLAEREAIDLDQKIGKYLPELKGSDKENITIRNMMIHQAGLYPYVSFWKNTLDSTGLMACYYSDKDDTVYCEMVAPGIYGADQLLEDSLLHWVAQTPLLKKNRRTKKYPYKYSDLGYYLLKRILERELNQPLDEFVSQNFYLPLGRKSLTYRPLNRFSQELITPTEYDTLFRGALVHGTVHDQGAAMMGGVAAHAGLFGTANDLAVLMQMNLQGGYYGGLRYLRDETVDLFTSAQVKDNRRGIGWDKPEPEGKGPTSDYASSACFGHSGFTGTAVWVDPEYGLVYVFLSNRVYPDATNFQLIRENIRTNIHDVIYEALPEKRPVTGVWPTEKAEKQ